MWTYDQGSGQLSRDGEPIAKGYAGHGEGKNNPAMEQVANTGPIPRGNHTIGPPRNTKDHGPHVLPLTPHQDNRMFGRSGFLIHGDSKKAPGTASHGCIILGPLVRKQISQSGDTELQVVSLENPGAPSANEPRA